MAFLDENGVAQFWAAVKDRLAGAFDSVEFDVAEQAANLVSGDSRATAFGKLAKNYSSILTSISDLNTSLGNRISEVNTNLTSQINTKLNKSDVLANYTTTATGKALDASLGPAIKTKMDLADTLNTRVTALDSKYAVTWTGNLTAVENDGNPVSTLRPDTNYWLSFPYTYTNAYKIIGVLGWHMWDKTGSYPRYTYYVMAPNNTGISVAFRTPSGENITGLGGSFTVMLQKK